MVDNSVRVIARVRARRETIEEVRELLSGLIEPTRKEVGCVTYELLQNRNDPRDFTFVEEWESEAALSSHAKSPHIRAIGAKLNGLLSKPPDIRTYSVVG